MKRIQTLILLLACLQLNAQQIVKDQNPVFTNIPILKIGDQLPDVEINNIINSSKKNINSSDFKDQLLIIDFWATGCSGCVEALPKMNALQYKFGSKIKILPVTFEKKYSVLEFWKNNRYTKKLSLPSVVEDKIFNHYFKHEIIPHEVWVYKNKIIAITSTDYVDASNINKVISGQKIEWPVKNDYYNFDGTKQSIFTVNPNQLDTAATSIKYAAISDAKEGANSALGYGQTGIIKDSKNKTIRAFFINWGIFNAYLLNLGKVLNFNQLVKPTPLFQPNQVIWEVADRSKYIYEPKSNYFQAWLNSNGICFESLNLDTGQTDQQIYKTIVADMDRLLGLKVRWEKRNEKVLVLKRTVQNDNLKTKKSLSHQYDDHLIIKGSLHQFRDASLNNIAYEMNMYDENPYVFDETNYNYSVDLDLIFSSWTNVAEIRKALKAYGLDLVEENRVVDKLIFTEVNGGLIIDAKESIEAKLKRDAQVGMKDPSIDENKLFLMINKNKLGVNTLKSGLQYKIIRRGIGRKPTLKDSVSVNYTGTLVNGKIFDSSLETGKPFITDINDVIEGWKEALQLMPLGSKWIIYIPSELAYGDHTNSGTIPRNSILCFELELLNILDK